MSKIAAVEHKFSELADENKGIKKKKTSKQSLEERLVSKVLIFV